MLECDCACGALVGLSVADALGHKVEFEDACDGRSTDHFYDIKSGCFVNPLNSFELEPGQWTDDTSMALCLADSLLYSAARNQAHSDNDQPGAKRQKSDQGENKFSNQYNGSDLRARFYAWWNHGYCNAFRFDAARKTCLVWIGRKYISISLSNPTL